MKKRIIAVVLFVVMLFSFVGCNSTELGFVDIVKSILMLQDFTFEGSLSLNIKTLETNELPIVYDQKNAKASTKAMYDPYASIKDMVKNMALVYSGDISKTDDKMAFSIGIKNGKSPVNTIIKLILSDKTLYISRAFTDAYGLDSTTYETMGGTEYAQFDVDELITKYIDSAKSNVTNEPYGYPDFNETNKSNDYIDGYYSGYENGLQDGYFDKTTPVVAGPADFSLGYDDGYTLGTKDGAAQKVTYDNNIAQLDTLGQQLKDNISSSKLINNMSNIRSALTKGLDALANMLFQNFSLDLIKIDDTSSYVISTKTGTMLDAVKKTALYLMDNIELAKATAKTIMDSLTDEELTAIGVDPTTRDKINADIDKITAPEENDLDSAKEQISQQIDQYKSMLGSFVKLNTRSSLEKIGLNAFDNETVISVKTLANNTLPVTVDAALISKLSINKELDPEISATDTLTILNPNSVRIKISVPDSSSYTVGILLSTDEFFTDCKVIKATTLDENGDYIITLNDLDPHTNYYYKTFTKDETGNVIYSSDYTVIRTVPDVAPVNPPTSDSNPSIPLAITFGLIGIVSISRKRKTAKA